MRKITLFLALMVTMITTAFAENVKVDVSKQYYLTTKVWAGTTQVTGYLNLCQKTGKLNTNAVVSTEKQVLTFEEVWEGTDPYYIISAMVASGTDGETKNYFASGSWDAMLTTDAANAERFVFEVSTSGTVIKRISNSKYLKIDTAPDNSNGVYTDADANAAAAWTLEEVPAETPVVEENKEYYLVNNDGASPLYFNLRMNQTSDNQGNGQVSATDKMIVKFEKVADGYHFVAMMDFGMGGAMKEYLTASSSWAMGYSMNSEDALVVYFEEAENGLYYVRNANGYFKIDDSTVAGGVYLDGDATNATKWAIVDPESVEEPEGPAAEPLTYVSHTPNTPVESINSVTITFDREVGSVAEDMLAMNVKLKQGTDAPARGASATIDGNSVTIYLNNNVTVSGNYKFVIADGTVTAADGGVFAGGEYDITIDGNVSIKNPTTSVINIDNKLTGDIEILFTDNIEFAEGAEKLQLTAGGVTVAEFIVGENAEIDGDVLVLTLAEDLEPEATTSYKLQIPANFIKKANSTKTFAGKTLTYKVKVPFAVKNITPATGSTVEAFENIVVEFNAEVQQGTSFKLVNTENNEEVALTATTSLKVITLTATDVANGTYKLVGLENVKDLVNATSLANAPEYTITVAAPELDALECKSSAKNAANEYELAGVRLNFYATVDGVFGEDRVKLRDGVTEYGKIVDAEGNTVAVLNEKLGANDHNYANLYTSKPVTTAGTYKVIVYSGVIVTTDGGAEYKGGEFGFEVKALPAPEVVSIDAPTGTVTSMDWYLDYGITIYNTREVVLAGDKTVTYTVGEEVFVAELSVGGTGIYRTISISFPWEDVTYPYGNYTLTIPAGLYTVNDVANEEEVYTFTYAEPTPTPGEGEGGEVEPVTVTVTPTGVVEQIDAIQVLFSNEKMYENIGWLYMYDQNENMYLLASAPDYGTGVFVPVNMLNDEPIVITEPGTYTLSLASYAEFGLTGETEFSWTIGETTAIDAVDAEAENAVIYDLTGRRVEKITKAGIYVINGVKKVVK